MALRPGGRTLRAVLVSGIVATFLLNGAWIVLSLRAAARLEIQQRALTFAALSKEPISDSYNNFYQSGYYKFRERIKDCLAINPDVERIRIVRMSGEVLFDSRDDGPRPPAANDSSSGTRPQITEPMLLDRIRVLDTAVVEARERDGFDIVAPYLEEWGRHELSIVYQVKRGPALRRATRQALEVTLSPTLLAAAGACLMVVALVHRVA